MKNKKTLFGSVVLALVLVSTGAHANVPADPDLDSVPEFVISGNTLTVTNNGNWVDGSTYNIVGDPILQAFACSSPKTASSSTGFETTYALMVQQGLSGCTPLYTDSSVATPFSSGDLTSAYIDDFGVMPYSSVANSRANIVMVSYVNAEFFSDPSLTLVRFGHSASSVYTYVPSPPVVSVDPEVISLSGSVLNLTLGQWQNIDGGPYNLLYSCPAEVSAPGSLHQGFSLPAALSNCNQLSPVPASQTLMANTFDLMGSFVRIDGSYVSFDSTNSEHGNHIVLASTAASGGGAPFWAYSESFLLSASESNDVSGDVVRAAPYTGPILNTPAITSSIPAGGKVVIPGDNLSGVSAVEIGGVAATVVVNSDGEIEIVIPEGLAAGTYDLVVVSSSGRLTVQNAITVSGSSVGSNSGTATPSTKRMPDDTAKVWVFDVVGAGKVQIFVNGKEIAWVRTDNPDDAKLTNGYLVRTVELLPGKNVIEVYVDGARERRTVYSN